MDANKNSNVNMPLLTELRILSARALYKYVAPPELAVAATMLLVLQWVGNGPASCCNVRRAPLGATYL